jgi:serine/threonine-protein kinase HipA
VSLHVLWDRRPVGLLERVDERSREYAFTYTDTARPLSLSLPTTRTAFDPAESRPFFEALLPEGVVREQVAAQLKLSAGDSYGLLAALGRDCAGAIQVVEARRMSEPPAVRWLDPAAVDELIAALPSRPLGLRGADERVRLSLAGVQRKAVLVRDDDGRYGEPLNGHPTTHILKPELADGAFEGIAVNEHFCMRLAARCGLAAANVALERFAGRPCLVVERFDRDRTAQPVRRLHQEDLCQALGITPDFKYQHRDWAQPSYDGLGRLLDAHALQPGRDRLAVADHAVFHVLVGNADAHAKNVSVLHVDGGVRLAPLYDVVSTAVYPDLNQDLALGIGAAFTVDELGPHAWAELAEDLGLRPSGFERRRRQLAERVMDEALALQDIARAEGWHAPVVDAVVDVIAARAPLVAGA